MQWNFIWDLPFGRGKLLGRSAGRLLDTVIGGWQLSGVGSMVSNWNALPTGNWSNFSPLQTSAKSARAIQLALRLFW